MAQMSTILAVCRLVVASVPVALLTEEFSNLLSLCKQKSHLAINNAKIKTAQSTKTVV